MAKKYNIPERTYIIKIAEDKIKNELSEEKRDLLKKAVTELNRKNLNMLRLTGKVQKFSDSKKGTTFVYKMSHNDRILFSVDKGRNNIWDVIDVKAKKSIIK